MTNDEIVRALRESLPPKIDYAELVGAEGFAHGACYVWDDPLPYLMSNAADALESLQAQLAESQRRERAAVEQIEQQMIFDAQKGCEPCEICSNADKTPCEECNPKWRGTQEAGKGAEGGGGTRWTDYLKSAHCARKQRLGRGDTKKRRIILKSMIIIHGEKR